MTDRQWYALGVIASGHSYYRERGVLVLKVRRVERPALAVCQQAFGGKLYTRSGGAYSWVLRGEALRVFLAILPEDYPIL